LGTYTLLLVGFCDLVSELAVCAADFAAVVGVVGMISGTPSLDSDPSFIHVEHSFPDV
jgi:hypothetical protein